MTTSLTADSVILIAERQTSHTQFIPQAFLVPTTHPNQERLATELKPLLDLGHTPPVTDSPRLRAETLAKVSETILETAITPTNNKVAPLQPHLPKSHQHLLYLPYTRLMGATAATTREATISWLARQAERRFRAVSTVEEVIGSLPQSHPELPILTVQEYLRVQERLTAIIPDINNKMDRILNQTPAAILLPVGENLDPYLITAWDTHLLQTLFGFHRLHNLSYCQTQSEFNYAKGAKLTSDPDYDRRFTPSHKSGRMVFTHSYLQEYLPDNILLTHHDTTDATTLPNLCQQIFTEHLLIQNDHTLPLRAKYVPKEQMKMLLMSSLDRESTYTYKQYTLKDLWGNEHGCTVSLFLDVQPDRYPQYDQTPRSTSLKGLHNLLSPDHAFAGDLYYSCTIHSKTKRRYNPQYKTPLDRALNNKRW